ncbi:PAS domain S-box protein [Nocardioides sp.]|uniref:sensor histidine kinase n=1 Tax=Nocardioides sp. TaxID=35761 RepID=UPI001A2316B4|nr:PAS domain S-box protein [Nocardioides sp.]MBJ7358380.1 PAS domain S-box protein [Nocardioides sp.]
MTHDEIPAPEQVVFDLLDATATAVVAVDESAVVRYANPRATELFGYSREELIGNPIELLVPLDVAESHVAMRDDYQRSPTARPLDDRRDLRGRRKDGTEFGVEISLTPLTTTSGTWIISSVLDVSTRREAEARIHEQSRSYLALARLNEAVAVAVDESSLYRRACNIAVVHGGFSGAVVLERGPGRSVVVTTSAGVVASHLAVASANHLSLDDFVTQLLLSSQRDRGGDDAPLAALFAGKPLFENDVSSLGERSAARAAQFDIQAAAALPLRVRGEPVACLWLFSKRPHVFSEDVRALLFGLADNISLALERFRNRTELDALLAQRTELVRRLVDAQELERSHIAADVHDESLQSLAAVDLRLGMLERRLQDVAPEMVADVVRVHEIVTSVTSGLRDLLFELEPVAPNATLADLVDETAVHVFDGTGVHWELQSESAASERAQSLTIRTTAIRIIREALVNVVKHAGAASVVIRVTGEGQGVRVEVIDDGAGSDTVLMSPPGHRGIRNMRDRAEVAGGSFSIESTPSGTTVSFWLPRR